METEATVDGHEPVNEGLAPAAAVVVNEAPQPEVTSAAKPARRGAPKWEVEARDRVKAR